ncbi:VOC family protein [Amantichitinum ursilacus]|uniref:Glyoxalase-like domain protein n=1 Tax=Amantichitinum ursilacus TaxID=857265 RepID=A0A0N0XKH4_9NEIS|nr:VOC family protein [Amantichitinum ursilacus]KPC54167.1 Glyoxalase-like domain protein [Amantichitinum ursilacus]
MQLAHIALWTRNLDQAAAFWQTYFGAHVGEAYHSQRRPGFVSRFVQLPDHAGQIELMTGPWLADAPQAEHIGWDHMAIALGSRAEVDALAARCKAAGCLHAPPRLTGDGFYEAVIKTPDGTRIEITA